MVDRTNWLRRAGREPSACVTGRRSSTDGPFVETKEAVGGFDIIECDSLEEAVEIAAGHPLAHWGRSRSGRSGGNELVRHAESDVVLGDRRALAGSVAGRHRAQRFVAGLVVGLVLEEDDHE